MRGSYKGGPLPGAWPSPVLASPPLPAPAPPRPVGCTLPLFTLVGARGCWRIPRRPLSFPSCALKRAVSARPASGDGGPTAPTLGGGVARRRRGAPSGSQRGPVAREGASGPARVLGRLPSLGARIQLLARLPRVSHEGIEESPRTRGFSLPVSPLRPVHGSFAE